MLVIVGMLGVVGAVMGGYLMEHGKLALLFQPAEFVIIFGAAMCSMLIATPASTLKKLIAQIVGVLKPGLLKADYADLLALLYQLFRTAQQSGIMALESHFEHPEQSSVLSKYPKFLARHESLAFLSDSIKVIIVGGMAPHDLEALMDEDIYVHHSEARAPSVALAKVADAFPGLGIVAAVLGVVITMQAIDGPPSEIGEKVGAALVGTFLGIFMSYCVVGPIATKIKTVREKKNRLYIIVKQTLLAYMNGSLPQVAIEFGRKTISAHDRPSIDAVEQSTLNAGSKAA